MNSKLIESIANAVLYEGYMLYPYRPSALKNRQRWNFGVVYPKSYGEIQKGSDACFMQTQCLVRGDESAAVDIRVRFLQAVWRRIGKPANPIASLAGASEPEVEIVESLELGNKTLQSWQEAIERDVTIPSVRLGDLLTGPASQTFSFPAARDFESVKDDAGSVAAFIIRTRDVISGCVEISATGRAEGLFELTVLISNITSVENVQSFSREEMLMKSLLSAHTVLGVAGGQFASLIDPPPEFQEIAAKCKNVGTWPVLVGDEHARDAMLSSPVILYDYPQIAPESVGDLFDGTEIDEILALRILTLSDEEKREVRRSDERAREVLERTESMPMEHFLKLHGAVRGMKRVEALSDDAGREDER